MDIKQFVEKLDLPMYERLKSAIELGKWPDGTKLLPEQKAAALQAIIAFEIEIGLPPEDRTGYLPSKESPCDSVSKKEEPIKWQH